jgi:ferredoxin-NADP reductase
MGIATKSTPPADNGAFHTIELLKRRWLSENAFEIELTRPASLQYKAGHNIVIIHESIKRYYSLLSTPDDPTLSLCVHHVHRGQFSPILATAEIGSHFTMTGPHGYFTFQPSVRQPVFVATGTGIAPFVSMSRSGVANFVLLHEATNSTELYYHSYFRKVTSNYFICLTEASKSEVSLETAYQGGVSVCLQEILPPKSYDFYLCGHRKMIRDVTLLVDEVYPGSLVYREVYF